jgi:peptide/nickel transport system substrate-binding protein
MAKRSKKIIAASLIMALFAGILSACYNGGENSDTPSPEVTDTADTQAVHYKSDDVFSLNCNKNYGFNPFTTTNAPNLLCTELMYDTLFVLDDNFAVTPNLIKSFKSDDGKSWSFYVDTSVKFWDGSTLTAQDAAYSLQRAMRSDEYSSRLSCVYGVTAMDASLFIVTLNYADMQFPALLSVPVIKYGTIGDTAPMGTGPYMLDESITMLTAFSGHKNYSTLPADTIYLKEYKNADEIISAYENSDIDLVTNDPTGTYSLGYGTANDVRYFPTTNMQYLGFNSKSSFFSSPACRKAMTYVVDREQISTKIMGGAAVAATLPMNPACALYNSAYSDIISYSVQKSKDAFDAANVQDYDSDGKREILVSGIPIEININFIVCSDNSEKAAAAESIANNLMELGITVYLKELSWNDYLNALKNGDFDMYYADTMMTADFSLRNLLFSGGSLNYGGFSDSALEQNISDYLASGDADRQEDADFMFKYITDTAPIVPVCFERQQVITHRGTVTGMEPTKYNIFHGIEKWQITAN